MSSVAFSPDGKWALTGSEDGTARVWSAETGQEEQRLEGHQGLVTSVAFSPDGKWALTGSADGTARVWLLATGQEVRRLEGHQRSVSSVTFSPDGKLVVSCHDSGRVYCWEWQGLQAVRLVGMYPAAYRILAIHWLDQREMLLADNGGPRHKPNFYRLKLEGF
jgi:WD40 repeat protein